MKVASYDPYRSILIPNRRQLTVMTHITRANIAAAHESTVFVEYANTPNGIGKFFATHERIPKGLILAS